MRIPLLTHDAILAAISHKIFNNHTILYRPYTNNRCSIYVQMLPHDLGSSIERNDVPKQNNQASINASQYNTAPNGNLMSIEEFLTDINGQTGNDLDKDDLRGKKERKTAQHHNQKCKSK